MDFRLFPAETNASKKLSASILYFTERKARYSLGDVLFRIVILPLCCCYSHFVTHF